MTGTLDEPIALDRPAPPPAPVSWEQFLDWLDEDVRAEWVDGEVFVMSPSSLPHQLVMLFLARVLAAFIEAKELGVLLLPPFLMRLPNRPSGREPDLMFIANQHADRVQNTYLDGPADLVVEIVSPDSDARDRGEKFVEYEQASIPEYWVIDPRRRQAYFYQLTTEAGYDLGQLDAEGVYRSAVLAGFWLRPAWLWQRPLPAVAEITRQLGV